MIVAALLLAASLDDAQAAFANGAYPEAESTYERFFVHRTIFPSDFLADFGFLPLRAAGRVQLARLELGGLQPVAEGRREKVLRVVKEAFQPAPPVPQRP